MSGNGCWTIFDPTPCQLGEGPTHDPIADATWFFDIAGRKLFEKSAQSPTARVHDLPFMASALGVVDEHRQLLATEKGLYEREINSGALSLVHPLEADNAVTRSNDSRVHPCGAMWIGTMGKSAEKRAGAIYHFYRGEVQRLFSDITVSNAICFSADGSVGYFTDTLTGKVMRVDLDPTTGVPKAQPTVFLIRDDSQPGWSDGAVMDADGLIWIAQWEGSGVKAYDGSARCVETIDLPTEQITCPAFIGPNASRMIVTSAAIGLSDEQREAQPDAGRTFLINRPFNGRPEPRVLL